MTNLTDEQKEHATVQPTLQIGLTFECPHCEEYIDLLNDHKYHDLNEEGRLYSATIADGDWHIMHEKFSEDILCKECGKAIYLRGVEW